MAEGSSNNTAIVAIVAIVIIVAAAFAWKSGVFGGDKKESGSDVHITIPSPPKPPDPP